jgi:hypothetical protein
LKAVFRYHAGAEPGSIPMHSGGARDLAHWLRVAQACEEQRRRRLRGGNSDSGGEQH